MSPLVERVLKLLPHVQVTVASRYSGWISVFMMRFIVDAPTRARSRLRAAGGAAPPRPRARRLGVPPRRRGTGRRRLPRAARRPAGQRALTGDRVDLQGPRPGGRAARAR